MGVCVCVHVCAQNDEWEWVVYYARARCLFYCRGAKEWHAGEYLCTFCDKQVSRRSLSESKNQAEFFDVDHTIAMRALIFLFLSDSFYALFVCAFGLMPFAGSVWYGRERAQTYVCQWGRWWSHASIYPFANGVFVVCFFFLCKCRCRIYVRTSIFWGLDVIHNPPIRISFSHLFRAFRVCFMMKSRKKLAELPQRIAVFHFASIRFDDDATMQTLQKLQKWTHKKKKREKEFM